MSEKMAAKSAVGASYIAGAKLYEEMTITEKTTATKTDKKDIVSK